MDYWHRFYQNWIHLLFWIQKCVLKYEEKWNADLIILLGNPLSLLPYFHLIFKVSIGVMLTFVCRQTSCGFMCFRLILLLCAFFIPITKHSVLLLRHKSLYYYRSNSGLGDCFLYFSKIHELNIKSCIVFDMPLVIQDCTERWQRERGIGEDHDQRLEFSLSKAEPRYMSECCPHGPR